ncbi:MAG: hypothetical protein OEV06_12595 [Anaerolineae bacterium]|nr:hypothetical protein [Anaerolineae bacterium]
MNLTGLHLLLTYQCTMECDHCFVWGSPWQTGTMTIADIENILAQAKELGTIEWIYFEGGEPFLFYATLLNGVKKANALGFKVGLVTNGYWALSEADAHTWLSPFSGLIQDLTISQDDYHRSAEGSQYAAHIKKAAQDLDIPLGVIHIAQPEARDAETSFGQLPLGESAIMYRGRAAEKLSDHAQPSPWDQFGECPYENLADPGRVHVDPFGHLHLCQGISMGSMFERPLVELCKQYEPETHPIAGPLLAGGPAQLAEDYSVPHKDAYADACHLCYQARAALREDFPHILAPDQMYAVVE